MSIAHLPVRASNCVGTIAPILISACSTQQVTRCSKVLPRIHSRDIVFHGRCDNRSLLG